MCRRISAQQYPCCSVDSMVPRSITLGAANGSAKQRWRNISWLASSLRVPNSSAYTQLHILSMSSQSVTMPCSMGYLIFSRPLYSCALRPMKTSPSRAPAMTRTCFGRPTLRIVYVKEGQCQCTRTGIARHVDAVLTVKNAQRREETFWMILTSKTGFYRSRSLWKRKRSSVTAFSDRLRFGEGVFWSIRCR